MKHVARLLVVSMLLLAVMPTLAYAQNPCGESSGECSPGDWADAMEEDMISLDELLDALDDFDWWDLVIFALWVAAAVS